MFSRHGRRMAWSATFELIPNTCRHIIRVMSLSQTFIVEYCSKVVLVIDKPITEMQLGVNSNRICGIVNGVCHIDGHYSALLICGGNFSPNNPRKTPIPCPLGRGMGVFREYEAWLKFYFRSCCAGCNIVLYDTVIYRESIVLSILLSHLEA